MQFETRSPFASRWLAALALSSSAALWQAGASATPNYARMHEFRQNTLSVAPPSRVSSGTSDQARLDAYRFGVLQAKQSLDRPVLQNARLHPLQQNTFLAGCSR